LPSKLPVVFLFTALALNPQRTQAGLREFCSQVLAALPLRPPFSHLAANNFAKNKGWTNKTVFYRSLKKEYLIKKPDGTYAIRTNTRPAATILDIYANGSPPKQAKELGKATLNVSSAKNYYVHMPLNNDQVIVAISMKNMLAAGGLPYPDVGTSILDSAIFAFEKSTTEIPVQIFREK
jgi:hypothetical protein